MALVYNIPGTSIKAVSLESFPPEAWTVTGGSSLDINDAVKFAKYVGVLYRCLDIRANSISKIPWSLRTARTGDVLYESSGDSQPSGYEWLNKLPSLISLTESALNLNNQAWWFVERNRAKVLDARWFAPPTMEAIWDEDAGLIAHERKIGAKVTRYPVEDEVVCYIWRQSAMHETEPATPPVVAAMMSAGVLFNLDQFTANYFERGAIKATLLTVKGDVRLDESETLRLKSWWKRMLTGAKNAFATEVVYSDLEPIQIGEGIAEIGNIELSEDKRADISTTLGVPHSMLFSNAANYATAQQDEKNFYSNTLIPDAALIADALNAQIFARQGLRFEWHPHTMDVFQADEQERAQSFATYVGAGIRPSIAAEMLGLELPEDIEYSDLDEEKPEPPASPQFVSAPPVAMVAAEEDEPTEPVKSAAWHEEAATLKRWIGKRSKPDVSKFNAAHLSDAEKAMIADQVAEDAGHTHRHDSPIKAMQIDNPAIDPLLQSYEGDLSEIITDAVEGKDDKPEFERRMRDVVLAALLLAFLRGVGAESEDELTATQAAALRANRNRANESVASLSDDIYNVDRYAPIAPGTTGRRPQTTEQGIERAMGRVGLWVTALAGMFAAGQLRQRPNKRYQWRLGNTVEHCSDCLRLSGQVHTSENWIASGYQPQGRNLECGGWNCDCSLVETDSEERGGF